MAVLGIEKISSKYWIPVLSVLVLGAIVYFGGLPALVTTLKAVSISALYFGLTAVLFTVGSLVIFGFAVAFLSEIFSCCSGRRYGYESASAMEYSSDGPRANIYNSSYWVAQGNSTRRNPGPYPSYAELLGPTEGGEVIPASATMQTGVIISNNETNIGGASNGAVFDGRDGQEVVATALAEPSSLPLVLRNQTGLSTTASRDADIAAQRLLLVVMYYMIAFPIYHIVCALMDAEVTRRRAPGGHLPVSDRVEEVIEENADAPMSGTNNGMG